MHQGPKGNQSYCAGGKRALSKRFGQRRAALTPDCDKNASRRVTGILCSLLTSAPAHRSIQPRGIARRQIAEHHADTGGTEERAQQRRRRKLICQPGNTSCTARPMANDSVIPSARPHQADQHRLDQELLQHRVAERAPTAMRMPIRACARSPTPARCSSRRCRRPPAKSPPPASGTAAACGWFSLRFAPGCPCYR